MRDIGLQDNAIVMVFIPDGKYNWLSVSYAGFAGTVTAMNEKGLAVGQMGGGGFGRWSGIPMAFLLRKIMEEAGDVNQAVKIVNSIPGTCEHYYVFSDKKRNIVSLIPKGEKMRVLMPGEQHPLLPEVPQDTVLVSGKKRAEELSARLKKMYGKIGVPEMIEIIKRPVAMNSNLHNAIFSPETLEVWFSDAGKHSLACDNKYVMVNLKQLLDFYSREADSEKQD
jgi:hypothetical protein